MSLDPDRVRLHLSPVWREKANFIINAPIAETDWYEQLWTRQIDDLTFEICCIPFFLYNVGLGDTVRTSEAHVLQEVIRESGRGIYRVFFPPESLQRRQDVVTRLGEAGALLEWSSQSLLAVDASVEDTLAVVNLLEDGSERGYFEYEYGRTLP